MPELTLNTTDYALLRMAREETAGLFGALDAKRPMAWAQYGYPLYLTFDNFKQAYDRGGAAFGAVHRLLDRCWQERPRIKRIEGDQATDEPVTNAAARPALKQPPQSNPAKPKAATKRERSADEPTPWEKKLDKLLRRINGWQKLRDLDRRNMIGRYAALILCVTDNTGQLRKPVTNAKELFDLRPLFEDQIKVTEWFSDPDDFRNFGKPKMFQYREHVPGSMDTQGKPDRWVDVDPSRVLIMSEGAVGDFFEGTPLLRPGFNHLVDLEKISGGSAEGYLKNSSRTVALKFDPTASVQILTQNPDGSASGKTVDQVLQEKLRRINSNIDAGIVTQGGEASTLQTTMPMPREAFEVAANLFAASVRIPYTILFGQQTGRLASDEDQKEMNARCESRQDNELTPMLEELVRRLQAMGLVEPGDFEVEWSPLDAPGDSAKYAQLETLTGAMQKAQQAGLTEPLFDANELRRVAGFEPRDDDGMPGEGDPGVDVEAEDAEAERQRQLTLAAARATGPGAPPGAQPGLRPRIAAV